MPKLQYEQRINQIGIRARDDINEYARRYYWLVLKGRKTFPPKQEVINGHYVSFHRKVFSLKHSQIKNCTECGKALNTGETYFIVCKTHTGTVGKICQLCRDKGKQALSVLVGLDNRSTLIKMGGEN